MPRGSHVQPSPLPGGRGSRSNCRSSIRVGSRCVPRSSSPRPRAAATTGSTGAACGRARRCGAARPRPTRPRNFQTPVAAPFRSRCAPRWSRIGRTSSTRSNTSRYTPSCIWAGDAENLSGHCGRSPAHPAPSRREVARPQQSAQVGANHSTSDTSVTTTDSPHNVSRRCPGCGTSSGERPCRNPSTGRQKATGPEQSTHHLRTTPGNAHWRRHSGDGPVR